MDNQRRQVFLPTHNDEHPLVQSMVEHKLLHEPKREEKSIRISVMENGATWWAYRKAVGKKAFDGLEIKFSPALRAEIHSMAVFNLPGFLEALTESFFDEEVCEAPPAELESAAFVLEALRHALNEGSVRELERSVRMLGEVAV